MKTKLQDLKIQIPIFYYINEDGLVVFDEDSINDEFIKQKTALIKKYEFKKEVLK